MWKCESVKRQLTTEILSFHKIKTDRIGEMQIGEKHINIGENTEKQIGESGEKQIGNATLPAMLLASMYSMY